MEQVFNGLLFDTSMHSLNETTIATLVSLNQRVVLYWSPGNFTGDSKFTMDGCEHIDNQLYKTIGQYDQMYSESAKQLAAAAAQRAANKAANRLYLASFANTWPTSAMLYQMPLNWMPFLGYFLTPACANATRIPGLMHSGTCPLHLMDAGLLGNYLMQALYELQVALTQGYDFLGAIYLGSMPVDVNGTVRTGTQRFGPVFDQ